MYKIETHLHTSEGSRCGKLTAEEMMGYYYRAGYKTVFVTNHFASKQLDPWGDIPWDAKMDRYLLGYRNAKAAGEALGMNVLLGAEFKFADSVRHYLVYGIDEAFLKMYPDLEKWNAEDFWPIAQKHNLLVIQAHPFRDLKHTPTPNIVHGLEVINPNPRHKSYDRFSEVIAEEFGLYRTSGSDAHRPEDVGRGGIASEQEIRTVEEFIKLVKSGTAKLIKAQEDAV